MTTGTSGWRVVTLPDGRVVEFVDALWADTAPDDPPNALPIDVTVLVDGDVETIRVLLTDKQMREAFDAKPG